METTRVRSSGSPFFIVGPPRSGTTLLRLMLAAHPRIAIPPESHFIPDLLKLEERPGGLEQRRDDVARLLTTHDRLVDFELEAAFIRTTVERLSPLTTRTITEALFAEYARRQGKPRWGDKTPRYRNFLRELCKLFPDARFIHLVRDGRDTALSAWRAAFGPRTWTEAAYLWRDAIRQAARGARAISPDAYYELRYEDLVRDPRATLEGVCRFLGEEFHPSMLAPSTHAAALVPAWERAWHAKLERPLDPANVGIWRRELTLDQIALLQMLAETELRAYGYDLLPIPMTPARLARLMGQRVHYHFRDMAGGVRMRLRSQRPGMVRTSPGSALRTPAP